MQRVWISIPSRGFWFFEDDPTHGRAESPAGISIPSRGFWFFEVSSDVRLVAAGAVGFQSPRGDFGFLKLSFEDVQCTFPEEVNFNPLAGILVF